MKLLATAAFGLAVTASVGMAQVVTPIWVQHLNGLINVDTNNQLPILRKNVGTSEGGGDGTSSQVSFGKMLRYDSSRFLILVRENGINESDSGTSAADKALAAQFPDNSLHWIDAATGKWLGLALNIGVHPVTVTGQGSQNDYYHEWGIDEDVAGKRAIYTGHKNVILRYAPGSAVDTWAATPTCAWVEPTVGASDCAGNQLDGSTAGDGNQSIRWREMRVTGAGTNTVVFAGGGTWRMGCQPQMFVTTDGLTFKPLARLDDRNNGAAKGQYALGGQISHFGKYKLDSTRPNLITAFSGHYPGAGYGSRPDRYQVDPDNPTLTLDDSYAASSDGTVMVMQQDEVGTNGVPTFVWEAAGKVNKDGQTPPEQTAVDGAVYYDGNWSCTLDANASLDYIVNYSMPSWNNQYSISGTNFFRPGWIGVHRLDGSISDNSAWKMPCTEMDIQCTDNGDYVGNDWGYCGDITLYPDTTAAANLKKAEFTWVGGGYGFGLFTVQNVAAAITAQPQSISLVEAGSFTLSATVSGSPNGYQWFKDGVALSGAKTNSDGSYYYPETVIQGVNKTTLYVAQAAVSDSGNYTLVVTNPLGTVTTAVAAVTVAKDTNRPVATVAYGLGTPSTFGGGKPYLVKVCFNKRVEENTAQATANYAISGGVKVNSAIVLSNATASAIGGDWREVILSTSGLTPGSAYTVTVSGVKDQSTSGNVVASTTLSFTAPVLTQGVVEWDYYYLGKVSKIEDLLYSGIYPDAPMTNLTSTSFDTTPITGGDLHNKAPFGALGDNYGDSLSGWLTPTVTTNYHFFLNSDDASQLFLSTDSNPANATQIAVVSGCCPGFIEPPADNTSDLISLVAGKQYFIQVLHTEGGGGDYAKVAWRMGGDTTAAGSLSPIPAAYLSAYVSGAAASAPAQFTGITYNAGSLTISWTNTGTLYQSSDLKTWTPVNGTPASPYKVAPSSANLFYRLK